ncbi:hypothetical protein [Actinomadura sp. DC4]|nr:hypothetical protein [Actinomadura sp. DC4]
MHHDELGPDLLAPRISRFQQRQFMEQCFGTAIVMIMLHEHTGIF